MPIKKITTMGLLYLATALMSGGAWAQDGSFWVKSAFDHMRGEASISVTEMSIQRPDWQRTMSIKAWTKGQKKSLFFITSPPRDQGNGTLKKGTEMWMFNPKINRVIKVPPSLMSQAWMGSDFSNNDLSKSDSILENYTHTIEGTETQEGKKVYLLKSMPKPQAPEIWGMQKLKIREDHIYLQQSFFDEDLKLVKTLSFKAIKKMGGRLLPSEMVMEKAGETGRRTILKMKEISFLETLPESLFTISSLRNPRR
jgi:outer membrane lipoprotein-sorting protein